MNKIVCKISDFGLSKILDTFYYEQTATTKNDPIPVKVNLDF